MRDPDALLDRAGVGPDTDQDQHFLVDDRVLDRLPGYLEAVEVDPITRRRTDADGTEPSNGRDADAGMDDGTIRLLEIGAGTGALTDRLLAVADRVTAIERDARLVEFLRREFSDAIDGGRLTVLSGDVLELDLPPHSASVSNLPYGVSSEILFELLPRGRPLVCTVQREFAERMVAAPGTADYGRLSVSAQHYAGVELVEVVPREAFRPPPAVESAVVRAVPRTPAYEVDDEAFFLRFVKALFTQRRKTVRNGIGNTAHIARLDDPDAVVDAADEPLLEKRPDAVTPSEFAALASVAADVGVDSD